jgi:hypothetical protein
MRILVLKVKRVHLISNDIKYAFIQSPMQGYVACDSSLLTKRPVVLILPEWWGVGDYVKSRGKTASRNGIFSNGRGSLWKCYMYVETYLGSYRHAAFMRIRR